MRQVFTRMTTDVNLDLVNLCIRSYLANHWLFQMMLLLITIDKQITEKMLSKPAANDQLNCTLIKLHGIDLNGHY